MFVVRVSFDRDRVSCRAIIHALKGLSLKCKGRSNDETDIVMFTTDSSFGASRVPVVLDRFGSACRVATEVVS